jgi:hypothetical protein
MVRIYTFLCLSELWPLCVTLPLAEMTWILQSKQRWTFVPSNIEWIPSMHVEALLRTSGFQWPLIVTMTFDLDTWFIFMTLLLTAWTYIRSFIRFPPCAWTKSLYFIVFSDLNLAYIKLNYMFHTRSHDNDHFCFNLTLNDVKMVRLHIFMFSSENWPLCVTLPLAAGSWILHPTLPHNDKHLCQVICDAFMYIRVLLWTSVFQWHLSVTLTFDLDTCFMRVTQLLIVVNISMKYACRR